MLAALVKSFRQIALMKGDAQSIAVQRVLQGAQGLHPAYDRRVDHLPARFLPPMMRFRGRHSLREPCIRILYFATSFASRKASFFAGRFSSESAALNFFFSFGAWCAVASAITFAFSLPLFSVLLFFGIYVVENLRKPVGLSYLSSLMDESILASSLSVESQLETLFAVLFSLLVGGLTSLFSLEVALLVTSCVLLVSSFVVHLRDRV